MGNEESKPQLHTRISKALPPLAPQYGTNENIDWVDKGTKAFASEGDREQFVCKSSQPIHDTLESNHITIATIEKKKRKRVQRTARPNRPPKNKNPLTKNHQTPSSPS